MPQPSPETWFTGTTSGHQGLPLRLASSSRQEAGRSSTAVPPSLSAIPYSAGPAPPTQTSSGAPSSTGTTQSNPTIAMPLTRLVLGPGRHEIIAVSQVLVQSSAVFQRLCTTPIPPELQDRLVAADMSTITFPTIDPSHFKLYLDWLYRDTTQDPTRVLNYDFLDEPSIGLPGTDLDASYGTTILGLYQMGMLLKDEAFCRTLVVEDLSAYIDGVLAATASGLARLERFSRNNLPARAGITERLRYCGRLLEAVRDLVEQQDVS